MLKLSISLSNIFLINIAFLSSSFFLKLPFKISNNDRVTKCTDKVEVYHIQVKEVINQVTLDVIVCNNLMQ